MDILMLSWFLSQMHLLDVDKKKSEGILLGPTDT